MQGKQEVQGRSTAWEVNGKGFSSTDGGLVVLEVRRYTSHGIKQADMGAPAYTIAEIGATCGILATPIDPQTGAQRVASENNIRTVLLDAKSTTKITSCNSCQSSLESPTLPNHRILCSGSLNGKMAPWSAASVRKLLQLSAWSKAFR